MLYNDQRSVTVYEHGIGDDGIGEYKPPVLKPLMLFKLRHEILCV